MMLSDHKKGVVLALLSAVGFGTLGYFGIWLEELNFTIAQALFVRFGVASLLIWPYLIYRGLWRLKKVDVGKSFLIGAIGYTVQSSLYFITLSYLNSGLTNVLLYLYPAFVTIFDCLVYRRRPRKSLVACLILMLLGCFFVIDTGDVPLNSIGLAAGVAMAIWYACHLMIGERMVRGVPSLTMSGYLFLGCNFSFGLYVFFVEPFSMPFDPQCIMAILGVSLVATVIPIVAIFSSVRFIGAPSASAVATFEPVVAVGIGGLVLHEALSTLQGMGVICIVVGILLMQSLGDKRMQNRQQKEMS